MNILILSESLWPGGSGGELGTYLYASLLVKSGMNIKIVTTSRSSSPKGIWSGLSVYKLSVLGRGKYLIAASLLSNKMKELIKWCDIVYCLNDGLLQAIPLIKRGSRKPIITHIHSYFPVCPLGSLYNLKENSHCKEDCQDCPSCVWYFERAHLRPLMHALASTILNSTMRRCLPGLLRLVDAMIFVSKAQRDLFLKQVNNISCISYVIYNPLPELSYVSLEDNDVGYFGGLSPLKGIHVLLKAWLKLHHKYQVKLHATKMGELASLEPLRKVGIIPYGKLNGKSYGNIYRKVRTVVFPSIWQEPLPYVVSEALLRGRLLVTSCVGGVPEIIGGLKGVSLLEPNDADALADALDWALSMDRSEAIMLGLKNREDTLKRFDNRKSISELIKVFEKVAN